MLGLHHREKRMGHEAPLADITFDDDGQVIHISVAPTPWETRVEGASTYHSQRTRSLLQAAEILKGVGSIEPMVYYVVETPDGRLGRDIVGFYTESPIKTRGLVVPSESGKGKAVEFLSLMNYGDAMKSQGTVARLKASDEYAKFVLLMKCGHCGYESPIETDAGKLFRECYCCGAENRGIRGSIDVIIAGGMVEI